MSTPDLHLNTAFRLDGAGRITSTREPGASRGPLFLLVRSATRSVWAVRAKVSENVARELDRLAREEPPAPDLRSAPVHAARYSSLVAGRIESGPAFEFPRDIARPDEVVVVEDERLLEHHFRGWVPGEIAAGRSPVFAVIENGAPVSLCFCARTSHVAAEAGVETAEVFRGRGFAPRVTAAWALSIRATGRVPLYSTSWTNTASLAVARKLGLVAYASHWSLSDDAAFFEPDGTLAGDPVAALRSCIEHGGRALLFDQGALPAAFFDLRTGVAGELVQKLVNYHVRMAAVVPDLAAHSPRFTEFAREANHGPQFRFFATRQEAIDWLGGACERLARVDQPAPQ
jgi:RimJ/RimL family protein N-acetyltransferase